MCRLTFRTEFDICSSIYMLLMEQCISVCFPDIASWMSAHHLKFSLNNIHVFCLLGKSCPLQDPSITADDGDCHPECQKFSTTLNPQCSHSLVRQIQHQTFPRQRLCPVPRSSLVISCLGYCDSHCSHTPSSPYNSSRTLQHASSFH